MELVIKFSHQIHMYFKDEQEIRVYTYQYVREDIMALYGFKTREERLLFMKLLACRGLDQKALLRF